MEYHLIDEDHIEVLAGDVSRGIWNYSEGKISKDGEASVSLEKNTRVLNKRKSQKVSSLDTMSELPNSNLIGFTLGQIFGPLGGLASAAVGLAAGKLEYVCIGCELLDGRKFIAWMRSSVYEKWNRFAEIKESGEPKD